MKTAIVLPSTSVKHKLCLFDQCLLNVYSFVATNGYLARIIKNYLAKISLGCSPVGSQLLRYIFFADTVSWLTITMCTDGNLVKNNFEYVSK